MHQRLARLGGHALQVVAVAEAPDRVPLAAGDDAPVAVPERQPGRPPAYASAARRRPPCCADTGRGRTGSRSLHHSAHVGEFQTAVLGVAGRQRQDVHQPPRAPKCAGPALTRGWCRRPARRWPPPEACGPLPTPSRAARSSRMIVLSLHCAAQDGGHDSRAMISPPSGVDERVLRGAGRIRVGVVHLVPHVLERAKRDLGSHRSQAVN